MVSEIQLIDLIGTLKTGLIRGKLKHLQEGYRPDIAYL